jgi:hypothetical protein
MFSLATVNSPKLPADVIEALRVVAAALDVRDGEPISQPPIRAALRVLLPYCRERWPLDQFWDALNFGVKLGRSQSFIASLNGIHRQMGLPPGWKAPDRPGGLDL